MQRVVTCSLTFFHRLGHAQVTCSEWAQCILPSSSINSKGVVEENHQKNLPGSFFPHDYIWGSMGYIITKKFNEIEVQEPILFAEQWTSPGVSFFP